MPAGPRLVERGERVVLAVAGCVHRGARRHRPPGAMHEVFNETDRDEVVDDVVAFLRAQLA